LINFSTANEAKISLPLLQERIDKLKTKIPNFIDKKVENYIKPSTNIKGGLHTATSSQDRDNIIFERRDWGMLCYVIDDDETYQLRYGFYNTDIMDNNNWDILNRKNNLVHNPITELISDIQGYGDIVTFGDTNGLTPGLIYYLNNDGNWSQSTNNSITESKGLLSIALGSNSSDGMLVTGYIKGLSYSLSIGQTIYLGQSGIITNNIPTDVGSVVRVIGYSINNNIIYFNPDNTWIQL
jgi:hypothetical protein